jgi:hypothetical protein
MTTTHYAMFDGEAFRPEGPIPLEPNTRVRISVDAESAREPEPTTRDAREDEDDPYRFLRIMQEANLDGPPDWSERLHYYLYGEGARSDE